MARLDLNKWFENGQRKLYPAYLYVHLDTGDWSVYDMGVCKCYVTGKDIVVTDEWGKIAVHGVTTKRWFSVRKGDTHLKIDDLARRYADAAFNPLDWDEYSLELHAMDGYNVG